MKIGIYKPFKKTLFFDDSQDVAAWSYEIVNIAKIFAEREYEIYLLSENDLNEYDENKKIENIQSTLLENLSTNEKFDRIFIWCGSFELDKIGSKVIEILREKTTRLDFFLTDRKLTPDEKYLQMFDHIYLQGTKKIFTEDKDIIESTSELVLYKHEFKTSLEKSSNKKDIEFYFGGTERERLDDFIEYVWRPGHLITTKSKFFNIENRVERQEFLSNLDRTKYSVVITDVKNNEEHFISPRPYECYIHDIIPFFDFKYDPDEYYCSKDDFRRVKNYKEMREKMNFLNNTISKYRQILHRS